MLSTISKYASLPIITLTGHMDVNETLQYDETEMRPRVRDAHARRRDETETLKKHVSRRPRPRRSRHETETFAETFKLKEDLYICNF